MKKIIIIPIILAVFSLGSCKKDTMIAQNTNDQITTSSQSARNAGTSDAVFPACEYWRVILLTDNGKDLTPDYNSLRFLFCPDNEVTVSNNALSFKGLWYLYLGKGGPSSYFELDFYSNPDDVAAQWPELDGMWKILGMDSDKITLETSDGLKRLVFGRENG